MVSKMNTYIFKKIINIKIINRIEYIYIYNIYIIYIYIYISIETSIEILFSVY